MSEAEDAPDASREGFMPTSAWGNTCPFRGQRPLQAMLDERCPERVPCIILPVRVGADIESHPVPILQVESYCYVCLEEHVREDEAGLTVNRTVLKQGKRTSLKRAPRKTLKEMSQRYK